MRAELLAALENHIQAHLEHPFVKAISGSKGARYYPFEAPQRTAYPYAVSFIVSDVDTGGILTNITDFEWQISLFAARLPQVHDLAAACKNLFVNQSLQTPSGCWFTCIYQTTYGPARQSAEDPFQVTLTFSCYL